MKPISSADLEKKEFLCEGCGDYHSKSERVECEICHTSYCINCYGDIESHPCARLSFPELCAKSEKNFNPSKRE